MVWAGLGLVCSWCVWRVWHRVLVRLSERLSGLRGDWFGFVAVFSALVRKSGCFFCFFVEGVFLRVAIFKPWLT